MKYFLPILFVLLLTGFRSLAQKENALIRSGNRYYKQKDFDRSQAEYQKALKIDSSNAAANYNAGNTRFRKNDFEAAARSYEASLDSNNGDKTNREKAYYNKGVSMIKQQKLEESIDAWKNALKIDPADSDARDNLEKALMEKKKQQQQQNNQNKDKKKDPKDDKQKQPQQPKQDQQQPRPQQSRLTKQQVEQLLKALTQKEKEVQDKMNQNKPKSLSQQEKDW